MWPLSAKRIGASIAARAAACLVAIVPGCKDPPSRPDAAPPASAPRDAAPPASATASAAPDAAVDPELARFCDGKPVSGKSMGHTSVVFKLELEGGKVVAFKAHAKKVRDRYRGEIAAYRLAKALGLPNVPPACFRTFDKAALSAVLNEDARRLLADEVVDIDGNVKGAIIPWIDGLQFWPLERDPLFSEAAQWLTAGSKQVPPEKMTAARDASALVVFDFLSGNWDRYSGENIGLDTKDVLGHGAGRVLFIDNDAAFMERPPPASLLQNRARLDKVQRFSKSLVDKIRELDEPRLKAIFGEESPGARLLPPPVITQVATRAKVLVAVVDNKARSLSQKDIDYFP